MSVLLETSAGDLVIDLLTDVAPKACTNFIKLSKVKYYNNVLFHKVEKDFMVSTGDPTGTGRGGQSVWGLLYGKQARFFSDEINPGTKFGGRIGTVAMVNAGKNANASQFFITTRKDDLAFLDGKYTIFGVVEEGLDVLEKINEALCDAQCRPYQNIRIRHTIVLDDPFPDPKGLEVPDQSPEPTVDQHDLDRIADDEDIDEDVQGKTEAEIEESLRRTEARSRAEVLEMLGDIQHADVKPPDNVLFVCKLNPVTSDEDLELIFSRFGNIVSCEVIRDFKTGESLQYAFIEYEEPEQTNQAYLKMDNVLIDDRRIHVDFSQSVSKLWNRWRRGDKSLLKKGVVQHSGGQDLERGGKGKGGKYGKKQNDFKMIFNDDSSSSSSSGKRVKPPAYKPARRSRSRSRGRQDRRAQHRSRSRSRGGGGGGGRSRRDDKRDSSRRHRDRDERDSNRDSRDRDRDRRRRR